MSLSRQITISVLCTALAVGLAALLFSIKAKPQSTGGPPNTTTAPTMPAESTTASKPKVSQKGDQYIGSGQAMNGEDSDLQTRANGVSRIAIGTKGFVRVYTLTLPDRWRWMSDDPVEVVDDGNVQGPLKYNGTFRVSGEQQLSFLVQVNLPTESTPQFYEWPICTAATNLTVWDQAISASTYSSISSHTNTPLPSCASTSVSVLDSHAVELRSCVGDDKQATNATFVRGHEELTFVCPDNMDLARFSISCRGQGWRGVEGQSKCVELLQEIIESLSYINNE